MGDDERIDAIWDYLNACTRRHGHQRTAERFGAVGGERAGISLGWRR